MLEDFPNGQFIFITRDGRDASADYLESAFGPTNIYCAAEIWKICQQAVKPWRERLSTAQWMDVQYERLVRQPESVLKQICEFLGEDYSPQMLEFYNTGLAKARGATRDHKPLGHGVSDKYVGIYKELLSLRDQRIFAAVAGKELEVAGYSLDVQPLDLSEEDKARYRELDGRIRAATLEAPEGHIVYESYNDWLIDRREERRRQGIWQDDDSVKPYPIGNPNEELIQGQRAWTYWKQHLCIKRRYVGKTAL
jgi:hypothetical protein